MIIAGLNIGNIIQTKNIMEIDYENKYKEAMEIAKLLRNSKFQTMNAKRVVDEIFPELADSEDERIRKAIVDIINNSNDIDIYSHKHMIAYLEKQKAKERLDRMAPIYNDKESFESALEKAWKYYNESASRTVDSFEDDYIECVFSKGFREGFLYKEKQKEQKPVEPSDDELQRHQDELYDFKVFATKQAKENHISFVHDFEWNNFCAEILSYFNQPVEWSDEEIEHLYTLASYIKSSGYEDDGEFLEGVANKLKSLRPQPKLGWSTKDKQMLSSIQNDLMIIAKESGGERRKKYLQKVQFIEELFGRPQTHWKPSDEQMDCLKETIIQTKGYQYSWCLPELYEQLKKLKICIES